MNSKRRLACWSGGGFPGIEQAVGAALAFHERGIEFQANCGCSAGSLVAAWQSADRLPHMLSSIVSQLTDDAVRHERWAWKMRALWIDWFLSPDPILRLLRAHLPDWSQLRKPLGIAVSSELMARPAFLGAPEFGSISESVQSISLPSAIMASMSIPGVFPKVPCAGEYISDGGTTNYLAIPPNWQEYDELWLIIVAPPHRYKPTSESVLSRLLLNAHIAIENQIQRGLAFAGVPPAALWDRRRIRQTAVRTLRLSCGVGQSCLRWSPRHALISAAAKEAGGLIDGILSGGPK